VTLVIDVDEDRGEVKGCGFFVVVPRGRGGKKGGSPAFPAYLDYGLTLEGLVDALQEGLKK